MLVQGLADVMMADYDQIREGFLGKLYRSEHGSWRLYAVVMTHEKLALFKDESKSRCKGEIWLHLIDNIELITVAPEGTQPPETPRASDSVSSEASSFPTQFAFRLSAGGALTVDFCALSESQLLHWTAGLADRIRAHQRAQRSFGEESDWLASSVSDRESASCPAHHADRSEDLEEELNDSHVPEDSASDTGSGAEQRFGFAGFTGRDDTGSKHRAATAASNPPTPLSGSCPARRQGWRARAERKIRSLQASLQFKRSDSKKATSPLPGKVV